MFFILYKNLNNTLVIKTLQQQHLYTGRKLSKSYSELKNQQIKHLNTLKALSTQKIGIER